MAWTGNFSDFREIKAPSNGPNPNPRYGNRSSRTPHQFTGQSLYGNQTTNNAHGQGINKICEMNPGMSSMKIICVIIAKEDARHFPNKKDPTTERWVLNFTVRDTPDDFINVTVWGKEHFIKEMFEQFRIADVVEIKDAGISSKPMDGSDERFRPSTPGMCQLTLGENRGIMSMYHGSDISDYNQLTRVPIKANNDYYTIGDIQVNGQNLHGMLVNMLVGVKKVCPYKEITTKDGRQMKRCEVKLFDETSTDFTLVLWSTEMIFMAQNWTPKEQVLFMADVKITQDDYKKCMIATATSKTVITVNPQTNEALRLFRYGESVELEDETPWESQYNGKSIDLETVQELCSIEGLKAKLLPRGDSGTDTCYTYAFVTAFDLDSDDPLNVVSIRCSRCRFRVCRDTGVCVNHNCPQGSAQGLNSNNTEKETQFDARISCADHTGTITGCYISGSVVEKMLNCTVDQFLAMDDIQRTNLKWTVLLERHKIYFKVSVPNTERPSGSVRIISCMKADVEEATRAMN